MKRKQLLRMFLMMCCLLAVLTASAGADNEAEFEYTIIDDTYCTITQYIGTAREVTIPSEIDGYLVQSIGEYAFYSPIYPIIVDKITVSEGITVLEDYAFSCCSAESVILPDTLISMGVSAFDDSAITEIMIPDGIVTIKAETFDSCDLLSSVVIPNSVTSIEKAAFRWCTSLDEVEIPDTVVSIGDYAFFGCTRLARIVIPDSVTSIGDSAIGAEEIRECEVVIYGNTDSYAETYAKENYIPFIWLYTDNPNYCYTVHEDLEHTSIEICRYFGEEESVVIPEMIDDYTVEYIGLGAFFACEKITSVTIHASVSSVGDYAFADCVNLIGVTIPDSVTSIGEDVFDGCHENLTIYGIAGSYAEEYAHENSIPFVAISGDEDNNTGSCGNSLTWSVDTENTLTIQGTSELTASVVLAIYQDGCMTDIQFVTVAEGEDVSLTAACPDGAQVKLLWMDDYLAPLAAYWSKQF